MAPRAAQSRNRAWQLQEAKNRLSHVVSEALTCGPQTITLRGEPAVVVVSVAEFRRMTGRRTSLLRFFGASPFRGLTLDVDRDRSPGRELDL